MAIAEAERRLPPMLRHAAGAPDDLDAAPERNGRSTVRTSPADSWLTICEHERSAAFASLVTWTSRTRLVGSARRLLSPADAEVGRPGDRIVVTTGEPCLVRRSSDERRSDVRLLSLARAAVSKRPRPPARMSRPSWKFTVATVRDVNGYIVSAAMFSSVEV